MREHRAATKSFAAWELVQLAGEATRRAQGAFLRNDPEGPRLFLQADSMYARAELLDRSWPYATIKRGKIALTLAFEAVPPSALSDSATYARLTPLQRRKFWIGRAIDFANSALKRNARMAQALSLRGDARYRLITAGLADVDSLGPVTERDLRAALDIRPDLASAWSTLASLYRMEGRFAESAAAAQHAFDADAFFEARQIVSAAFSAALHAQHFDDARHWCRLALEHYSGDPRFVECELTLLGWTARSRAEVSVAWQQVNRIEQRDTVGVLEPTWEYRRLMVAAILARAGMPDSARAILKLLQARPTTTARTRSSAISEAYVRLLLNDRDGAVARVAELVSASPQVRPFVANHPWLSRLQDDGRFAALIRRTR
jgi:tetratricopeptide (TPR) repeat protein